jgi:Ca2+-binding EF-hand superfamily protein
MSELRKLAAALLQALPENPADVTAADEAAEQAESDRLEAAIQAETHRTEMEAQQRQPQGSGQAIKPFYRRNVINDRDSTVLAQMSKSSSPTRGHAAASAAPMSSSTLRFLLKSAARHLEVERYMELIEAWETIQPSRVWDALREAKKVELDAAERYEGEHGRAKAIRDLRAGALHAGLMSYDTFLDAVRMFQEDLMEAFPETGLRLCELVTGCHGPGQPTEASPTKKPKSPDSDLPVEAYFIPRLDAQLFISCRREPNGAVEYTRIYSSFMVQLSVLKSAAELIMRDLDNDGRLTEEDLEEYASLICRQVPMTRDTIAEDLVPFYACMVTRRLMWGASDTKGTCFERTGGVNINKLIDSEELKWWIQAQLSLEQGKDGWYSASNFLALYDKFCGLDRRNKGLLERGDFAKYKKGIPPVSQDGLPPGTCPIAELFIDRYFEMVPMFDGEMDFKYFVDFTLLVEFLPTRCPRPGVFFDIFDLDGDGVLTPMDLQHFFKTTRQKLVAAGLADTVPVELFVRELFDALCPAVSLRCTRDEFIKCTSAGVVCGTLIDPLTFYTYDSRDSDVSEKQQQLYRYEQPLRR